MNQNFHKDLEVIFFNIMYHQSMNKKSLISKMISTRILFIQWYNRPRNFTKIIYKLENREAKKFSC